MKVIAIMGSPLQDDWERIKQKILAADGIILSTPGNTQNVSGLMKNFMDRFAAIGKPDLVSALQENGGYVRAESAGRPPVLPR